MKARAPKLALLAAGTVVVIIAGVLPAQGLGLFHFRGTVRDAIGRPLAAAKVSDGDKTATAAADGTYSVEESTTGRYTLTAWRSDTLTVRTVVDVVLPVDQTVDFALLYKITGSLPKTALSTASGPALATLTVTSYTPSPGSPGETGGKSCVHVTDTRTGATSSATYASTGPTTGASKWTHVLELARGTTEGTFSLSYLAKDCDSGTALSPQVATTYTVDNTPVTLFLLAPLDQGNTVFTSQPIVAYARDLLSDGKTPGGSGLDTGSLTAVVVGGGAQQNLTVGVSGEIARSSAASLALGTRYQVTMTARDRAGNDAKATARFLAMQASGTAPVRIPATASSARQDYDLLNYLYIWDAPTASVDAFSATLNDTLHSGGGQALVGVSPQSAVVTYTTALGPASATPQESDSRTGSTVFSTEATGTVSVSVPQFQFGLGRVTAVVPKTADPDSVKLSLDVRVPVRFRTCPDPTASSEACTTDPLTANDRRDVWEPWATLLNEDPYVLPEKVAPLAGLSVQANRCSGPPPSLSESIANLGNAMNVQDSLNPNVQLDPVVSEGLARIVNCMAVHIPLVPATSGPPDPALRSEWLSATRDLLSTIRVFPTAGLPVGQNCIDTQCLVETSGSCTNDSYYDDRPLIIDQCGDDQYFNNAAGAQGFCCLKQVAIVLDQGGNDLYDPQCDNFRTPCVQVRPGDEYAYPTIGSGSGGGIGILVDQGGDDTYRGKSATIGIGTMGVGYLLDAGGVADRYEAQSGTNFFDSRTLWGEPDEIAIGGGSKEGFGFLVDLQGNDTYQNEGFRSIGYGQTAGVGLIRDDQGGDAYLAKAPPASPTCDADCNRTGLSIGFGGLAVVGQKGSGVVLDGSGNDSYSCAPPDQFGNPTGTLAYGCIGAIVGGSLGLVYNRGGSDSYFITSLRFSGDIAGLGSAYGGGSGIFVDTEGVETYDVRACQSIGYGSLGVGVFLDLLLMTDDTYKPPTGCLPLLGSKGNNSVWMGQQGAPVYAFTGFGADR